jgi:hypothetical protein
MMKFFYWFLPTVFAAIAMARVSVWIQQVGIAPVLVIPLLAGGAVGLLASAMAVQNGEQSRARLAMGLVISALCMAAASHGFFYLDYYRQFEAGVLGNPKVVLWALQDQNFQPRPHTFLEYLASSAPKNWPLWIVDAAAMIAGAVGVGLWTFSQSARSAAQPPATNRPLTPDP